MENTPVFSCRSSAFAGRCFSGYDLLKTYDVCSAQFNPLKTKRRPLYLKTQSVPCCKHFSSGL